MRDLRSVCPSREWINVLDVKLYIYVISNSNEVEMYLLPVIIKLDV